MSRVDQSKEYSTEPVKCNSEPASKQTTCHTLQTQQPNHHAKINGVKNISPLRKMDTMVLATKKEMDRIMKFSILSW